MITIALLACFPVLLIAAAVWLCRAPDETADLDAVRDIRNRRQAHTRKGGRR